MTLLGQNVNAYGVEFGDRRAFAKLLRACGEIDGLERVRFTSPHPKDFTDDVIAAMAETPNVMPQLHMPLQSGSDAILRSMRRSYRSERYLGIIDNVRAAMPEAAITTDIIVGFPERPKRTSRPPLMWSPQHGLRRPSPSSTPSAQVRPRRRWMLRSQGSRPGSLRPLGRSGRRNRLAGEPEAGWPGRGDVRRWRGPQGPANPSDVRARPRQPASPCLGT